MFYRRCGEPIGPVAKRRRVESERFEDPRLVAQLANFRVCMHQLRATFTDCRSSSSPFFYESPSVISPPRPFSLVRGDLEIASCDRDSPPAMSISYSFPDCENKDMGIW